MTEFTELDFDRISPLQFFIDRKAGLKISLGTLGALEGRYESLISRYGETALSLQASGIDQDLLDGLCLRLASDCEKEGIEALVTKNRHPFDPQWYILGDLKGLLEAAELERVSLPFGRSLIDPIKQGLEGPGERP